MVVFRAGDVLDATEVYVAQGVAEGNQEGLGTGLALEITRRYPDVQAAFKRHARSGRFRGGDVWACDPAPGRPGFVYLATQPDMYHATLPYVRRALRNLATWSARAGVASVALPKIGCGLGKLSWPEQVKPLVVELLSPPACSFVVYETYRQGLPGGARPPPAPGGADGHALLRQYAAFGRRCGTGTICSRRPVRAKCSSMARLQPGTSSSSTITKPPGDSLG